MKVISLAQFSSRRHFKKINYWRDLMRIKNATLLLISFFLLSCQGMEANNETFAQKHEDPAKVCETGLFIETAKQGSVALDNDPTIVRKRLVEINFDLLGKSGGNLIQLNLFKEVCLTAVLDRKEVRSKDDFTWLGKIKDTKQSQVTMVVKDGVMAGTITLKGKLYKVQYAGDGVHAVLLINQAAYGLD